MDKKLLTPFVLLSCMTAVCAVASLVQVERLQGRVDALATTMHGLGRNVSRNSSESRIATNQGLAQEAEVAASARAVAPEEAPALEDERAQESEDRRAMLEPPSPVVYDDSRESVLVTYDDETSDPDWSATAASELDDLLRRNLPGGSRLDALECRSTMCRIDLSHPDAEAHSRFVMEGLRDWPGSIFVADEIQKDGEYIVTLYAAREGTELPLGPR